MLLVKLIEPPCTEPYARWCERSKISQLEKFSPTRLEKTEALRMKRYLLDYSNTNLLPSGEIKETKSVYEDKIPKIDYYRAV